MWLRSITGRLASASSLFFATAPRTSARRRPASRRPLVEPLENRIVLSMMAPVSYPVDSMVYGSVVAADLNGDGRSDLAIHRDTGSASVAVRLANADGTFQPIRNFSAGASYGGPQSIAAGDFNGDGRIDLATAGVDGSLSILLGNGDGTFASPIQRSLPDSSVPLSVATADLNGDGQLDLAVGAQDFMGDPNLGKYLYTILGNGDGTFQTPISHGLPPDADTYAHPWTVQSGDFNGDGHPDVVTARMFNTVNVLLGNGDGTLGPAAAFATGPAPTVWSHSVAIGDFNADGHLDLVATDSNGATVSVLPGDGSGAFPTYQTHVVGSKPASVMVADMNGDGRTDVVTANSGGQNISVLLGKADGTFHTARNFPAGAAPYALAVGAFNGDSLPDLAVINTPGQGLSVLLNGDCWTTSAPPSIRINDVAKAEGQKGTTYFYFTVTLSVSSDVPVTVNYATANGTATSSSGDYTAATGSLTFAPGETTRTLAVAVKGDKRKEADETFFVNLGGAVNASILDGQGLGTILNDD